MRTIITLTMAALLAACSQQGPSSSSSTSVPHPTPAKPKAATSVATPAPEVDQWKPVDSKVYTFRVEPNYPDAQAQEVYKPLMVYLSHATGHTFELQTTGTYHLFWRSILNKEPADFAFEEAHFVDYQAARHQMMPLVKTMEPSIYDLLADPSRSYTDPQNLVGRRVVSMSSPSLGYLLLNELYSNPLASPEIQSQASTWRDGVEMLFSDDAEGAMAPDYIAKNYPNLQNLMTSRSFPGRAVVVAPSVPQDIQDKVKQALLHVHEDESNFDVVNELGTSQFVDASADEYKGNEQLLANAFGYKPLPQADPAPEAVVAPPAPPSSEADNASPPKGVLVQVGGSGNKSDKPKKSDHHE